MEPLHDARLQLYWANKHIKSLDRSIQRFFATKAHTATVYDDPEATETLYYVEGPKNPPEWWAMRLGEAVSALRSCLDYIMWELSHLTSQDIPPRKERQIMFPILAAPNGSVFAKATQFAPHNARDIIETLQPYNAGEWPETIMLLFLDRLVTAHKHRRLTLVNRSLVLAAGGKLQVMPRYFDDKAIIAIPREHHENLEPKIGFDVLAEFTLPDTQETKVGIGWYVVDDIHKFIRDDMFPLFTGFFEKPEGM